MRKFEDVDIISALRKIVDNNNLHYKTDYEYDVEMLRSAAEGSHFLWMSRTSGTYLFDERDVYVRNSYAHQSWQYYDTALYGVKAFAVTIRDSNSGKPLGDIYELDYKKHKEEIKQNSFSANTVDVTFKPTHIYPETTRNFDVVEYNELGSSIIHKYGKTENVHYNIANEGSLMEILADIRERREAEAVSANVNNYVREIVKERFHSYGYKRDDMVFTTPEEAYGAIKHIIPVYILYPDNTADQAITIADVNNALYSGNMLGMGGRDKKLLKFFMARNTLADLPFSQAELSAIFFMALDKGKENIEDEQQKKAIDSIIKVLDALFLADDGRDIVELEQDQEFKQGFDEGAEL